MRTSTMHTVGQQANLESANLFGLLLSMLANRVA